MGMGDLPARHFDDRRRPPIIVARVPELCTRALPTPGKGRFAGFAPARILRCVAGGWKPQSLLLQLRLAAVLENQISVLQLALIV